MNIVKSNWQKTRLDRYVEKIRKGKLKEHSFEATGFELLRLLFAYRRSQYGLNLRWHKADSLKIAWLTVQDLKSSKKTDPVLNGIYDALVIHGDGNEALVKKLLETAEGRLEEISSSQQAKARGAREPNPVVKRAIHHTQKNKDLEPWEIIELIKNDVGRHQINSYDDELEKFFYTHIEKKSYSVEKSITLSAVRNVITKLKK